MTVGVRNGNGRLYNSSAFATAFEEYKKKVDAGEAYGRIMDIEHPERSFENNISDISHRVTEVRWNTENGEITGKAAGCEKGNDDKTPLERAPTWGALLPSLIPPAFRGGVRDAAP